MHKPIKYPYKIEPSTEFSQKWKNIESVKVMTDSKIIRAATHYPKIAENLYNFRVRPDDVWVITFPRSGTTLTQEMTWLIANDDYEFAAKTPLIKRFPYLESYAHITDEDIEEAKEKIETKEELQEFLEITTPEWITLEKNPNRRFIKSHLQFPLLPPNLLTSGCKIIYVARNPKDAALSLFKFRGINSSKEYFGEFWDLFQNGCIENTPYWDHVIQGWNLRGNKNFCFMFYEDIVKDMKGAINKVAAFLGKTMTREQVEKLANHLDIVNFRKNESIIKTYAYYLRWEKHAVLPIRKGEIGGWRDYFTDEINAKANKWIEENYKRTDLRFPVNFQ